ncbi:MAG TPA: hypothetical protein P5526_23105 [Anaerolineae bacterium]|nr:hypothetical protein [Anaerolineae bacterium]
MMMRKLKVLLLTSKKILPPNTTVIGDAPAYPLGDKEVEDYIELLSASNIAFDIHYNDELSFENIVSPAGHVQYSTIVLALPEKLLSDENLSALKKASWEFGVSIVASYQRIGHRSKEFFGIDSIKGKQWRLPCTLVTCADKLQDPKIEAEIKLGDGWQIPIQKWGLKRHPIRFIKKHFKKLWEQVFFYLKVVPRAEVETLAFIQGTSDPAIFRYRYGQAINYYIALQSDVYLDRFNSLHRLIREIIRYNSGWGMVEVDLQDTMILRMDDPGTCERIYLKGYDSPIMGKEDWHHLIKILETHKARLSVMYIPLWVDDANPHNGKLFVKGEEVGHRARGATYHSKDVRFIKSNNGTQVVYDYEPEFQVLQEGLHQGWLDIESHGLTHVDTDLESWLEAKDRYSNLNWYHEFRHVNANQDVTEIEQVDIAQKSAEKIEEFFGVLPTAITPSGHEQSLDSECIAHENGYKIFSSEFNSIQKNGLIIRNDKIASIFLEAIAATPSVSAAGYPIVGVFHDYELVQRGVNWLDTVINEWREFGINKFVTLRELAGYLCASVEAESDDKTLAVRVDISNTGDVADSLEQRHFFNSEMTIDITLPNGKIPATISVDGSPWQQFEYCRSTRKVKLTLPPFFEKDYQEVTVTFALP